MKFQFQSLIVAGLMCAAFTGQGRADTPAQKNARREIAALYQRASRGLMHMDLSPVAAMEAPDFQSFAPNGTMKTREQGLLEAKQAFAFVKSVPKVEGRILSFSWRGPDAIVVAQNTVVMIVAREGKTVRVETVNTSRDYWSRGAQGWQVRQSVNRMPKVWVNGKRTV